MTMNKWISSKNLSSKNYICDYCGCDITSKAEYYISNGISEPTGEGYIYLS